MQHLWCQAFETVAAAVKPFTIANFSHTLAKDVTEKPTHKIIEIVAQLCFISTFFYLSNFYFILLKVECREIFSHNLGE